MARIVKDTAYWQRVEQAKAYRKQLNARGVRFSEADRQTARAFPGVDIQDVNPHKSGGFSKIGGAVGDVVGTVAPFTAPLPFIGPLVAAGATLAGKTLGKLNDPGGIGKMKVFKEAVVPAASTYALGSLMGGGAPAAQATAVTPGLPAGLGGVASMGMKGAQAVQGASKLGALGQIAGAGKSVLNWAGKNPELALGAAGMGLEAYGAHQAGKREDQALERQWDTEDDLRAARTAAWQRIRDRRQAAGMI